MKTALLWFAAAGVFLLLMGGAAFADVNESFDGLVKASYTPDTTWNGWHLSNALCNTDNPRSGRCVRLHWTGITSLLEYVGADGNGKDGGVGTFSFWYRAWDGDPALNYNVMTSIGGAPYGTVGTITTNNTVYQQFSYALDNASNDIKIKIERAVGPSLSERLHVDDFFIADYSASDTTRPTISSITVLSATQLDVLFSESVEQTTAETEGNYVVTPGNVSPSLATRDGTNFALVHLTFAAAFTPNTYTLTVNSVQDLAGNAALNATGQFTISPAANPGDVVINEILYDDTASTDIEWVEVHNRTASSIDMSNWILQDDAVYPPDGGEGAIRVPAGTTLPANGYLILCEADLPGITGEVICTQYIGNFGLGNSGDNLALYTSDPGGTLIDGTLDSAAFYPDLSPSDAGASIEKCVENSGWSGNAGDWHVSTNLFATIGRYRFCTPSATNTPCVADTTRPTLVSATPLSSSQVDVLFSEPVDEITAETVTNYSVDQLVGNPSTAVRQASLTTVRLTFANAMAPSTYTLTVNNVEDLASNAILPNSTVQFTIVPPPYNIIFTEFMPNPNFVGTGDSLGEWFEVYNAGASAVDLAGWRLTDNAGADTIEGPATIGAGQYFVFCSNGDSATNGGVPENFAYRYATSGWGLSLSNTADVLTLRDPTGYAAASLSYTTSFRWAAAHSAQLRDLLYNPAIDTNWCRCDSAWPGANNGDFGTPGTATICPAPFIPDTVTLCAIRQQDSCGVPLLLQQRVVSRGVVTWVDTCKFQAWFESNGCAVLIFGTAVDDTMIGSTRHMLAGDSIMIDGYISQFRGVTEFATYSGFVPQITLILAGTDIPPPGVILGSMVSIAQDTCAAESYESRRVTVENVTFQNAGGTFAVGDSNYLAVSGAYTLIFRVDSCDAILGTAIPSTAVNVTAFVGQYDSVGTCYCGGYQLIYSGDAFTPAQCVTPLDLTVYRDYPNNTVTLRWQPGVNQPCDCYEVWYSTDGGAVFPTGYTFLNTAIGVTQYTDTDPFSTKRFYVVLAGGANCP